MMAGTMVQSSSTPASPMNLMKTQIGSILSDSQREDLQNLITLATGRKTKNKRRVSLLITTRNNNRKVMATSTTMAIRIVAREVDNNSLASNKIPTGNSQM
jgi:hypothetical protein